MSQANVSSARQNGTAVALFVLLSLLAVSQVALTPGWPMNHEGQNLFVRTIIYAAHIASGDVFPIWSSVDNYGFGSPQPALYHKLFYVSSGSLYALMGTGALKAAMLIAVCFWLVSGAYGTYTLCRVAGSGYWFAVGGGAMLLSANYTTTNWLVRGAMAEFSGAMLVPWALAGFIRSTTSHRIRLSVPISLALLFLAHSVQAYFLVLLLSAIALILLLARRLSWSILRSVPGAVAVFSLIVGPFLFAMSRIGRHYDISLILPDIYLPENQIKPLASYLFDPQWHWGTTWASYTVALDPIVLLLLAGGGAYLVVHHAKRGQGSWRLPGDVAIVALTLLIGAAGVLQTRYAIPFYRHVPGASFIQFPWRLLAVLTPACIALSLSIISRCPRKAAGAIVAVVAPVMFLSNGAFAAILYERFPVENMSLENVQFSSNDEYVPVASGSFSSHSYSAVIERMAGEGCDVSTSQRLKESIAREYTVRCDRQNTVALPVFSSEAHTVRVRTFARQRCGERADFPALCAVTVPAGESRVDVEYPTFVTLAKAAARELPWTRRARKR